MILCKRRADRRKIGHRIEVQATSRLRRPSPRPRPQTRAYSSSGRSRLFSRSDKIPHMPWKAMPRMCKLDRLAAPAVGQAFPRFHRPPSRRRRSSIRRGVTATRNMRQQSRRISSASSSRPSRLNDLAVMILTISRSRSMSVARRSSSFRMDEQVIVDGSIFACEIWAFGAFKKPSAAKHDDLRGSLPAIAGAALSASEDSIAQRVSSTSRRLPRVLHCFDAGPRVINTLADFYSMIKPWLFFDFIPADCPV